MVGAMFLLPKFVQTDVGVNYYLVYGIVLLDTLLSYMFFPQRSLIYANQQAYVDNIINVIFILLYNGAQILALALTRDFTVYWAVKPIFTILECVVVYFTAKKMFPYITNRNGFKITKQEKNEIFKNTGGLFVTKIGTTIITQTSYLIISAIFGLVLAGLYSNYLFMITTVTALLAKVRGAMLNSVGNMIVESDKQSVKNVFSYLNFFNIILTGFCAVCFVCLFQHWILIWAGENFILPLSTVILVVIYFYLNNAKEMVVTFKQAGGILRQDVYRPIIEAILNIGLSIGLSFVFGLDGVLLGAIIANVLTSFWIEPIVMYKHLFSSKSFKYFFKYALYTVIAVIIGCVTYFVVDFLPDYGTGWFVIKVLVTCVISGVLFIVCCFKLPEFHQLVFAIKNISIFKKKTKTE